MYDLRVALSSHTGSLARSLSTLAMVEENSELKGALCELSNVQQKVETIHGEQARADFFLLAELIKDYIGLVAAVKDVFQVQLTFFFWF